MLDERRYDIDALRSIALFLLIFYHLAVVSFTSVAKWILFVPNNKPIDNLWGLLNIFNIWRIPLLFIIAGIALRFSFQNRIKDLFKERLKRLGIPYLFGSITFVPLYLIISAQFIYGDINMDDSVGIVITIFFTGVHLWFLINILIYCFLLIPIINFLSNKKQGFKFLDSILNLRGGVLIFSIPIVLEGHLLDLTAYNQETYGNYYIEYANTDHGLLLGFLWFFIGIVLTSQGDKFWEYNLKKIYTLILLQ